MKTRLTFDRDGHGLTLVAIIVTLVSLGSPKAASRDGAAQRPSGPPPVGEGAKPHAGASELPVVEVGNCPRICAKLLKCKAGPFDTVEDCGNACEASIDDRTSARTYRCAAKARSCAAIATCTK